MGHRPSSSTERRIFLVQGSNQIPPHWQGGFLFTVPPGKSYVIILLSGVSPPLFAFLNLAHLGEMSSVSLCLWGSSGGGLGSTPWRDASHASVKPGVGAAGNCFYIWFLRTGKTKQCKSEQTAHVKADLQLQILKETLFSIRRPGWNTPASSPPHCAAGHFFLHPFSMGLASEHPACRWCLELNEAVCGRGWGVCVPN